MSALDRIIMSPAEESSSDSDISLISEINLIEEEKVVDDTIKAEDSVSSRSLTKEEVEFDPLEYYKLYNILIDNYKTEKMKNHHLQRLLKSYYQKRKMFYVFLKSEVTPTQEKMYEEKLDSVLNLWKESEEKNLKISEELILLQQNYVQLKKEVDSVLFKLQESQSEIANKILPHEHVEELYKQKIIKSAFIRQKRELDALKKMRTTYLILKNRMKEAEDNLIALDNLGSKMRLMDYEQLKERNQVLRDTLDKKEEELTKVKRKYLNTVQVLAHVRQENDHLDVQIKKLQTGVLRDLEDSLKDVRIITQDIRKEKIRVRRSVEKMKDNSGLLLHHLTLRDMENTIKEMEDVSAAVSKCKAEYGVLEEKLEKVEQIKKKISKKGIFFSLDCEDKSK